MVAVVPSPTAISQRMTTTTKKTRSSGVGINIPTINLGVDHHERSLLPHKIVQACEEYGFFKVVNHGVPKEVISTMENQGNAFFAKTASEKQQAAGPATSPFGYRCKNIGFNGDMGELEYLLLPTTNSPRSSVSDLSEPISSPDFSCALNDYTEAVRELACELLNLLGEGLRVPNKSVFSRLIRDVQSDSCFRLNHYPPLKQQQQQPSSGSGWEWDLSSPSPKLTTSTPRMGFGEHSDPQILTILHSNDVEGLQICTRAGLWVPVPPYPSEFCVFVGDALQAMTNGRFVSVRHRVLVASSVKSRRSMMYFGAPPLNAWISPLPKLVSTQKPIRYKPFTWSEFKKAAYSLRLGDCRLDLFKIHIDDEILSCQQDLV